MYQWDSNLSCSFSSLFFIKIFKLERMFHNMLINLLLIVNHRPLEGFNLRKPIIHERRSTRKHGHPVFVGSCRSCTCVSPARFFVYAADTGRKRAVYSPNARQMPFPLSRSVSLSLSPSRPRPFFTCSRFVRTHPFHLLHHPASLVIIHFFFASSTRLICRYSLLIT